MGREIVKALMRRAGTFPAASDLHRLDQSIGLGLNRQVLFSLVRMDLDQQDQVARCERLLMVFAKS